MDCRLAQLCSGCGWIGVPYSEQIQRKTRVIHTLLGDLAPASIEIVLAGGESGLRDRADLTWRRLGSGHRLGLYNVDRNEVVDIDQCPQLSETLNSWLTGFRGYGLPGFDRGSVRLRVSPSGDRGVWLDIANTDAKALLDDGVWLRGLMQMAFVEIGQKFKPVTVLGDGKLKLGRDPQPRPWFQTFVTEALTPTPLYAAVGSFTQPGFLANRTLVNEVVSLVRGNAGARVLELFSGLGNFTLPLASLGMDVTAFEVDDVALRCFDHSLEHQPSLKSKIQFLRGNLYDAKFLPQLFSANANYDVMVVDPPRSGLKDVVTLLENASVKALPGKLIYVSCFAESLVTDLKRLISLGYNIQSLRGVDQFPQSPHCEWVVMLSR